MKKLFLSFFALTMTLLVWAAPNGTYHVNKALLHYAEGYSFAAGEEWELTSADDEDAWDVDITTEEDGTFTIYNLLGWGDTLEGSYDSTTGKLVIPTQNLYDDMGICGGISGYTDPQALADYIDSKGSYVKNDVVDVTLSYDQKTNSLSLESCILTYYLYDYPGYVGFVSGDYCVIGSGFTMQGDVEVLTITCNIPEGISIVADNLDWDRIEDIEFDGETATIEGGVADVIIYNVPPYIITSVKVDGVEVETDPESVGKFYFLDITEGSQTIEITVEEQEVENMTLMVYVDGLNNFDTLYIMDEAGETGKTLATKETLENGGVTLIDFTNFDLPLQIYGTWQDGAGYVMTVALDGQVLTPQMSGATSAQYFDINAGDWSYMTISLSAPVSITVNNPEGVSVFADIAFDNVKIEFENQSAQVTGAQDLLIYNVDPYRITSVEVDGEEIEAIEEGKYYFVEINADVKNVNITVEEVEVVEMTMDVYVEGLENFDKLMIMDYAGETGKALATKATLNANGSTPVNFTNLDLPLMIYATWEDGHEYEMTVTADGMVVNTKVSGPTYAQYFDVYIEDGQTLYIELKSYDVDLYLRGSMNGWDATDEYKFTKSVNAFGEKVFTLTGVEFEAGSEFKLASEDWSTLDFGAESWDVYVPVNRPKTLVYQGLNMKVNYDVTSDMVFTFNLAERTLLVQGDVVPQTDLYLRGSMNGWGTEDAYKFTQTVNDFGEAVYTLTGVEFEAGSEFKIADADWGEFNFGGLFYPMEVPANEPFDLIENGANLTVNYDVNKDMVFTFNLADMTLLIEGEPTIPTPEYKEFYLRGDVNYWGVSEEYKFTTEDNIVYTLTGVTIEEGSQFKFANENWSEVNLGGNDTPISANQDYQLYNGGYNMTTEFTVTPSDVFELNMITKVLVIRTGTSAIQSVNADSLQGKWYNLQGIEVNKAQLMPGAIYINNGKKVLVK